MPISVNTELVRFSQREFAQVAYRVMGEAFILHRELGHLFDERVYQNALAARVTDMQTEVRIDVSFRDFGKAYFIDAVVAGGAVFELKAVAGLTSGHRGQLLNYLLLTGLHHGKLVNFRAQPVEHEFVNTTATLAGRTKFAVDHSAWQATVGFGHEQKALVMGMLQDWGTGLTRALYEEAMIHFYGGPGRVFTEIDVSLDHASVAKQVVALCAEGVAFRITTFDQPLKAYREDLVRFIASTALHAIQWINIARDQISFSTVM